MTAIPQRIITDLIAVVDQAIESLSLGDFLELKSISNKTIHNASIYQDKLSTDIAILLYSLSKLLQQNPQLRSQFLSMLNRAKEKLSHEDFEGYEEIIHQIIHYITEIDIKALRHIMHVIEQAKIKKGSKVYDHGISLTQSANAMGISQWELYSYIGKTRISEKADSSENIKRRLAFLKAHLTHHKEPQFIFDAGPVITMAMNNLLWSLPLIKKETNAHIFIPDAVKGELVDRPLHTKKYKLEAFQVMEQMSLGTIELVDLPEVKLLAKSMTETINNTFYAHGNPIKIVHPGEMEAIALMKVLGINVLVVDERTTRYMIETPERIKKRFSHKFRTGIHVDKENYEKMISFVKGMRAVRSAELLTVAYELGLYDRYIEQAKIPEVKKEFLQALLWGLKLNGCGINEREIAVLTKLELRKEPHNLKKRIEKRST